MNKLYSVIRASYVDWYGTPMVAGLLLRELVPRTTGRTVGWNKYLMLRCVGLCCVIAKSIVSFV